jgi:hypothetical protein
METKDGARMEPTQIRLSGEAILLIGRLTKDPRIADRVYEDAEKLAREEGEDSIFLDHIKFAHYELKRRYAERMSKVYLS